MNLLAHAYLSESNEKLLIGNCIGDFIKGNQILTYPVEIQRGVRFHRMIDSYTDSHKIVKEALSIFRPTQKHYSGVAVDILFDHILAKNWNIYGKDSLEEYAQEVYTILQHHKSILPPKAKHFFRYMIQFNWLVAYASEKGISRVLQGMSRRSSFKNDLGKAFKTYQEHSNHMDELFDLFWKEINAAKKTWEY